MYVCYKPPQAQLVPFPYSYVASPKYHGRPNRVFRQEVSEEKMNKMQNMYRVSLMLVEKKYTAGIITEQRANCVGIGDFVRRIPVIF